MEEGIVSEPETQMVTARHRSLTASQDDADLGLSGMP